VAGLSSVAVLALLGALVLDVRRREPHVSWAGVAAAIGDLRRRYAGYGVHLGFIVLAIGITGSALGTSRFELDMKPGDMIQWAGRQVRYDGLVQRQLPDKLVAEAVLEISHGGDPATIKPARHLHLLQNEWTTEVAIRSTWAGDFYAVLNAARADGSASLTLVDNPMMRWLWVGGAFAAGCALVAIWPGRRPKAQAVVDVNRSETNRYHEKLRRAA
jgi:cytochrome c-type biogenesis protein CcmF